MDVMQLYSELLGSKMAGVIYSNCQILKEVSLCHRRQNTVY